LKQAQAQAQAGLMSMMNLQLQNRSLGTTSRRRCASTVLRAKRDRHTAEVKNHSHSEREGEREQTHRKLKSKAISAGLAALIAAAPISNVAIASEFDVLDSPVPETSYLIDDGNIINKTTKKAIANKLGILESKTGYHLNVVTMRKLQFTPDAFEFSDKVLEKWYPTKEQGDKKGVLLIVSSGKEGALSGGPAFLKMVGNDVLESIVSENIPILTGEERFNEATLSCIKRISAKLTGDADPGPPIRGGDQRRARTYKTKGETAGKKTNYTVVVGALLVIAFVVPMLQFFAYTREE